ncbi:MAG: DUF721 domain-containing protein [Calditrichaeota bacterium]|nr:MAG: DUF721 domain-containing protein [Calditrichota bacterium]
MKPLAKILDHIFSDPKLNSYFIEGALTSIWPRAVGEQISGVAKPSYFKDGVLHVKVSSAVWRNELSMMSPQIIEKLNELLGRQAVQQIVFR